MDISNKNNGYDQVKVYRTSSRPEEKKKVNQQRKEQKGEMKK